MPPTSFSFQFIVFPRVTRAADWWGWGVTCAADRKGLLRWYGCICLNMCVICLYICVNVCKCYGNLRVQSTVLDGLQGSFGGPWGVLWGSWGSCGGPRRSEGVLGRAGGVPGRFREGPGGGLKNVIFSFFRGEFVNGLMKYWCFQFWVILWGGRWSLRYATFLSFLEACFLRNSEVNML